MRWAWFCLPFLLVSMARAVHSEVIGNVRVQVLSANLVRLEERGPSGFEDRKTFHVVNRDWLGIPVKRSSTSDGVVLNAGTLRVVVPSNLGLKGCRITDKAGKALYEFKPELANSAWLPSPSAVPAAWAVADTPRVVPSKAGLAPFAGVGQLESTSGWDTANDAPDVYVFLPGGNYSQLRQDFLALTGPVEMPPLFMLGYIDSRYFSYHEQDALARIDEYRRRRIPLDVFVVDTDWRLGGSHGYVADPQFFPDMPRFLREAHKRNVKIMFNDHPEPASKLALDPAELKRRADGLGGLLRQGVDVWWYDRNWFVGLVPPAPNLAKEVWGMKLYRDITQATRPEQRPVIMANVDGIDNGERNRPPNIAAHRYPVQWTGDTTARWAFLRAGVANAVDEGVEGLNAWVNEDLGGHIGNPDPDLYIRFLQYGSVAPVMRVHCTKGQTREPWAFGPNAERIVPEYIRMRYRLMPLLYASAREAYETGLPMVRRLDLFYPEHPESKRSDEFLLGDSLLVAPIVSSVEDSPVPAPLFHTPDDSPGLKAEYFANQKLEGSPAVTRVDSTVNFDWHFLSPVEGIPTDHWSARWTGKLGPIPGNKPYHVTITGDDGVRVWLDGKLVVDKWVDQDSVVTPLPFALEPGKTYDLKVEYFDSQYGAVCKLRYFAGEKPLVSTREVWIPPGTWSSVWTGEAFSGPATVSVSAPLAQMPMFVRAGAVIPLAPEMEYTAERPWDAITLDVYPGGDGKATVYEDDGIGNGYLKNGFRKTLVSLETRRPQGRPEVSLRLKIDRASGSFQGALVNRSWKVRVHIGPSFSLQRVMLDGRPTTQWTIIPGNYHIDMPFVESGPSQEGSVLEIEMASGPVSQGHTLAIDGVSK